MTPYPRTLKGSDTLKDAARLFFKYRVNGAPVVDDQGQVCGLITNAHLVEAIINDLPFTLPVDRVMTKNVVTVNPEHTLEEVWQIPMSRLPVVSAENKLVGMLTQRDFLNAFYTQMRRAIDEVDALVRSAHNGIVVVNAYGIVTTFNEATAKLTGIEAKEAIGRHICAIIPDTGLIRVLDTGNPETGCEITINGITLFSNRSPICEGPKIVGALAIIQDTSELIHIARQLTNTQLHAEALENIFECAPQGIVVLDKNGVVIKVNRAYEEAFGISREELLGNRACDVIENTRLHIVLQTGVPELGDIQECRGRHLIVNRMPLFKGDEIIGVIGEAVFKDINQIDQIWERIHTREKESGEYRQKLNSRQLTSRTLDTICGRSRAIVTAKNLAMKAAAADSNVLITGESGTGKELFAQAIHSMSQRGAQPFVAVNCSAIPAELLEAELFGYEDGAFTGARRGGKKGKFQLADTGTIFLDEIGDMPLAMQAKLLRIIEDRKVEPLGGVSVYPVDVRIIAATNRPLYTMVQDKMFREDLYYRLNVISLPVPPLRERREDIGELIGVLAERVSQKLGQPPKQFAPETLLLLRNRHWPGNVRELLNLLEQLAATVTSPVILPKHLPGAGTIQPQGCGPQAGEEQSGSMPENEEYQRIVEFLKQAGGNKALAAKLMGIHRSTLYEKLKKYQL
jgi:transcriptional regulator with PAS, ATPase and Fis domain